MILKTTFTSKEDLWFLFVLFLFFASVIQFLKGATSGRIGLFWLTVWEDIVHHGRRDMAAEALQQGGGLRQLLVA